MMFKTLKEYDLDTSVFKSNDRLAKMNNNNKYSVMDKLLLQE